MSIVNSVIGTNAKYNSEPGESLYTTPGDYIWTCPPGVYNVTVLCIGGGGCGTGAASRSGGGGGLGWRNNISVVPGNTYNLSVGLGGQTPSANATNSFFFSTSTVRGSGGISGNYNPASGGGWAGTGGGSGGTGISGAGGAGGYNGNGGDGGNGLTANGNPGSGGSGGGGAAMLHNGNGWFEDGGGGGGVGIYGQGNAGAGGRGGNQGPGSGGEGGKSGSSGADGVTRNNGVGGPGGLYGGGGGRGGWYVQVPGYGANGVVRIIWGLNNTRTFPNTNTQAY
jgi:hypothetical protein